MVAYYDECDAAENPKTLTDWVRNFRVKRQKMRRKLRGAGSDLRVNAILSTALLHAEHELRRKQQERFSRWLDIQTRFVPHGKTHCASDACSAGAVPSAKAAAEAEAESNLWSSELSSLDSFMRSLSSNNGNHGDSNNNHNGSNSYTVASNNNNSNNGQHSCAIAVAS
ncbi:nuclear transcription factor Y subunit gamma [Drosophila teissieri]|uniref:nuclear transcription factor Y subunit gamma n=1 Tax=Drosophila teissieri TaxID=7243 RepID=UPI001CBA0C49|nr:nuclear transcription factor Y subunit gamma [Drosophila teissieri]